MDGRPSFERGPTITPAGGPRLLVDGSAGELTKRSLQVTGGDRLADLDFPGVPTSNEAMLTNAIQGQSILTWAWDRLVALKCAAMVGGIDQVLSITVDYAKATLQFCRPIGSFQAVQHYCADWGMLLGTPDEHLERVATSLENSEPELGRCRS